MNNLVEHFLAGRQQAIPGGHAPQGSIVLTPRFPDSRHVVILLLAADGSTLAVAKVVRAPGDPSTLDREAAVLAEVESIGQSVPSLLALEWVRGHRMLLQSAVAGAPVTHRTVARHPARWWARMDTWLNELPRSPAVAVDSEWADRYVAGPVALARRTLLQAEALTPPLEAALDLTVRAVGRLGAEVVEYVIEHGDLSHPNILWSKRGIGVVDWETGETRGLPGVDAAVFSAFVEFALSGAHTLAAQERIFGAGMLSVDGSGRRRLVSHLEEQNLDHRGVDLVIVCAWGRMALGAFGRLLTTRVDDAAAQRAVQRFLTSPAYPLWRSAVEHVRERGVLGSLP